VTEAQHPGLVLPNPRGLLLDAPRLRRIAEHVPPPLPPFVERELRRKVTSLLDGGLGAGEFARFVMDSVCGFGPDTGSWERGPQVGTEWGRRAVTGETVKPRHLWRGSNGAVLPLFLDDEKRLGIGRGRRAASQVVHWLRTGGERVAVLTNGRQWRLIFAALDYDAWCEWDADLWLEEGGLAPQVDALRTILSPAQWTPPAEDEPSPLVQAVLDSRKGQAELSAVLGERVREAVELLVQAHGEVLKEECVAVDPAEIYRAAVRIVMRMVVVLFAESRDLLPGTTRSTTGRTACRASSKTWRSPRRAAASASRAPGTPGRASWRSSASSTTAATTRPFPCRPTAGSSLRRESTRPRTGSLAPSRSSSLPPSIASCSRIAMSSGSSTASHAPG
jgi:hypothetical protein